jgi:hypothetical protein
MHSPLLALWILSQTSEAADPENFWVTLLQALLAAIGGGLVLLVQRYGSHLVAWLVQRTGSAFLGEVAQRAMVVATSFYQSEVRELKKTGKWDAAAKKEVFERAKEHLAMMLDEKKLVRVAGELGVDKFLEHNMEAAVHAAKTAGKIGESADPTEN